MSKLSAKKKVTTATLLLALMISLSGCFQEVPSDKDGVSAPVSSASASASAAPTNAPSAAPEVADKLKENDGKDADLKEASKENKEYFDAVQKEQSKAPLGVNIANAVATTATPEAKETFAKFDVEEGTRFSLDFFQKLVQKGDFYEARDSSKDFSLLGDVQPMMTGDFQDQVKKDISEAGKFVHILTTNSEGSFGTDNNGVDVSPVTVPTQVFNVQEVAVDGAYLRVSGYAKMTTLTKAGNEFVFGYNYSIWAVPGADGTWQVSGLTWNGNQVN